MKPKVVESVQRLRYGMADRSSIPGRGNAGIYLFATVYRLTLELTQVLIQWVDLCPELKQAGREADHSPPSSANTPSWRGA
jgi:hypothetical protein